VTLQGTVERIVFAGGDGAFTVARLRVEQASEPVTIVGALLGIPVGAALRVVGHQENNPRFGPQVRVTSYTEVDPATLEGVRRYLGSGLIKGIGPEFAARIVERFGIRTLEILDESPHRISEVAGIGPSRAKAIREAWSAQREVRKVMVFLQGHGVSPAFAARIYKRYGAAAVARVRENPYRLAFDVWGIGFASADRLAGTLGIDRESDVRVEAGVRHVIEEASTGGDVFVPQERLVRLAGDLLGVDADKVASAIERLARAGELALEARDDELALEGDGGPAVYGADLWNAEEAAARGLARLAAAPAPAVTIDADRAVAWYEKTFGLALAPKQAEAVRRALSEKVVVITGGPGVGKTTIVRGIVAILGKKGLKVALAAPTGRAAKRLAEATGLPASTLHRLLEWRPAEAAFARNAANPLEVDLLVVDESSMLDTRLCADLVAALPDASRLILVGDVDQLPSVGPGAVLKDVLGSGVIPSVRLTEIFRQAASSLIVTNAHRIHDGELPDFGQAPGEGPAADARDFFFLEEEDAAAAALLVRDLVVSRLPRRYGVTPTEIQVLAPMHRGELGAGRLNQLLQEALTPQAAGVERGGRLLRVGDKVMQLRNDYDKEVFNGDLGVVAAVDAEERAVTVTFDDRPVTYESDEWDQLALAYAMTVHKSQGSEYPVVVIPVHTQHFVMLQRNLLYTAVTRGKRLVVLVGSRKALGLAVRRADTAHRCTRLGWRLAGAAAKLGAVASS
jgi:exodeoxyribonuclease V alpha subunit